MCVGLGGCVWCLCACVIFLLLYMKITTCNLFIGDINCCFSQLHFFLKLKHRKKAGQLK